jgi:preprotein translocase subunit YajC
MNRNIRVLLVLVLSIGFASFATVAISQEVGAPAGDDSEGLSEVSRPPASDVDDASAADGTDGTEDGEEGPQREGPGSIWDMLRGNPLIVMVFGMLIIMWLFSSRNRRKQESQRRKMLAELKKGDKITTIGGVVGTVVEVREDEVTIKVDDSTRMKFARWAVRGVGDDAKTESPDERK